MKKLRFFKALTAAAALVLALPGCSDLDTDGGTNTVQTQGKKIALDISASRGFEARTALPSSSDVDLTKLTYELTAAKVLQGSAGAAEDIFASGTTYSDLTKAKSVYIEAGTYNFTLTASNSSGAFLASTLSGKEISENDASLSFSLQPISENATGSLKIEVSYDSSYGGKSVNAVLYVDGTAASENYPLVYTPSKDTDENEIAGKGVISSANGIPVGQSYVKIELLDEGNEKIGEIPQEYIYAVKGITSSSKVEIPVKRYKATIKLTTSESTAPVLTLKTPEISSEGYTGIVFGNSGDSNVSVSTSGESPYTHTYSGYVPLGNYDVYIGESTEAVAGKVLTDVTSLEINTTKSLVSIAASLASGTYFVGTELDTIKEKITITGVYSDSSTENLGNAKDLSANVTGYNESSTAEQTLSVKYGEFAAVDVTLQLIEDYITEWSATLNEGVSYKEGDTAQATDVTVKAKWASAPETEVTLTEGFSVEDKPLASSDTSLTVTLTAKRGEGVAETKTVEISVQAAGASATADSWNLVLTKADDGKYYYNDIEFANETNIATGTKLPGANSVLYLKVTDKFQLGKSGKESYGICVKNSAITIEDIKGSVKLTVVWGTESKSNRSLTVKIGNLDAETITATGKNIKNETEADYVKTFDAGSGSNVVIGATADTFIKSIKIEADSSSTPATSVAVTGVTLDSTSATLTVGDTKTLTATIAPENASDKTVTWSSSAPSVASVDESGKVTALASGNATITVTTNDGSKTATCEVTVEAASEADVVDVTWDWSTADGYAAIKYHSTSELTGDKTDSVEVQPGYVTGSSNSIALYTTGKLRGNGSANGMQLAGDMYIPVSANSVLTIKDYSGYTNYTISLDGNKSETVTDAAEKSWTAKTAGFAKITSSNYFKKISVTNVTRADIISLYGSESSHLATFPVPVENIDVTSTLTFLNGDKDLSVIMSESNGSYTFTAMAPDANDSYIYEWRLDLAKQESVTNSCSVSSLSAGSHAILVTATEASTGLVYSANYTLVVSE
ncbi:Ig-like domain-containing protein [uncultured Treponema sp.]|uniref:Ig-like domain-containing protein n=1 Tax=uncultured Treponema sp. TaxID=162155 RepID=UPI0025DD877D|nr:Ig-like domain-containing protein [uncultured Treponema sp.]